MQITPAQEIDMTKTWSGLPAPNDYHIIDAVWDHHPPHKRCGHKWERLFGQRITVIEDITVKADGRRWLHVSVAKPNGKMPTYEDIQEVRRLFIGKQRECYRIYPIKERYINFAHVLHLWSCIDKPDGVLPHMEGMWQGQLSV